MILALSLVSCRGLWILTDARAERLLASEAWTDTESFGLNAGVGPALERILMAAGSHAIERIGVVTGPGAFTGLRIACSFAQGLARARGATLFSIPTYDLFGHAVAMPLQHQKARHLERAAAITSGMEFLVLKGPGREDFEVRPPRDNESVVGLASDALWPTPEALFAGLRAHFAGPTGLNLIYGLEPKISGKRL